MRVLSDEDLEKENLSRDSWPGYESPSPSPGAGMPAFPSNLKKKASVRSFREFNICSLKVEVKERSFGC